MEDVKKVWESMIEQALENNIKVILLTPTPDTTEDILNEKTLLNLYAEQVRYLAAKYKIGLVDSYAIFKDIVLKGGILKDYMSQNNHPNEAGHRLVADEILTWFNQAKQIQ